MTKFYSISENNNQKENDYQLNNLGEKTVSMIISGGSGNSFYGERKSSSSTIYRKITPKDYDSQFATKLVKFNPPYDLEKVLNYHLEYYLNQNNSKKIFIKHIKYVIIPIIDKKKRYNIQIDLITDWINQQMGKNKENKSNITLKTGDVNSPIQFQINSDNSSQSQTLNYSSEDIIKLFEVLKNDLDKLDKNLREDLQTEIENAKKQFEKGKDIKTRLLTIGELIKDIGIGVFTSLVSSPIYELMKPLLGV